MSEPMSNAGRVAIVEDDAVVRRLMRLWLEADGYEVIEFSSGREAGEHDARGTALVCLDLSLEDTPGLAVLERLRARDPDLPVIVVTGDQESSTVEDAMRAGAYDYVVKPFEQGRLRHAVRRAIERRELMTRVRQLHEALGDRAAPPAETFVGVSGASAQEAHRLTESIRLHDENGEHGGGAVEPLDDGTILNLRELERRAIARALEVSGGSVGKAAKLLGIGRATLYRRLSEQRDPSRENGVGGHHGHPGAQP